MLNLSDYAMPDPGRTFFVEVPDSRWAAWHLQPRGPAGDAGTRTASAGDIVAVRQKDKLLLSLLHSVKGKKLVLEPQGSADPGV